MFEYLFHWQISKGQCWWEIHWASRVGMEANSKTSFLYGVILFYLDHNGKDPNSLLFRLFVYMNHMNIYVYILSSIYGIFMIDIHTTLIFDRLSKIYISKTPHSLPLFPKPGTKNLTWRFRLKALEAESTTRIGCAKCLEGQVCCPVRIHLKPGWN